MSEEVFHFLGEDLQVPDYDYYGYYDHVKTSSPYESLLYGEYAKWNYSPRVSKAIKSEVEQCREKAAVFDLSSFGKVNRFTYERKCNKCKHALPLPRHYHSLRLDFPRTFQVYY